MITPDQCSLIWNLFEIYLLTYLGVWSYVYFFPLACRSRVMDEKSSNSAANSKYTLWGFRVCIHFGCWVVSVWVLPLLNVNYPSISTNGGILFSKWKRARLLEKFQFCCNSSKNCNWQGPLFIGPMMCSSKLFTLPEVVNTKIRDFSPDKRFLSSSS